MGKLFGIFIFGGLVYLAIQYFSIPDTSNMDKCFVTAMHKVNLCPNSNKYAPLRHISPNIRNAIVISEDVAFFAHNGFDIEELKQSFKQNLKKMSFARGGSTITQQLAKNLYLSSEKTLTRKLKEFVLTQRIEKHYSKNQILEKYLNVVEFGSNIYGVVAATNHYFQKPPSMISPLEAAFLAFLLPSPKKYSVSFKNKELTPFARTRVKDILFKMYHYKKIYESDYKLAVIQLETMFKSIPEMENESLDYFETSELRDLSEIQEIQTESIDQLRSDTTPEEPQGIPTESGSPENAADDTYRFE